MMTSAAQVCLAPALERPCRKARHWSDWVGFFFFFGMAASILIRTPVVGLLVLPILLHEMLVSLSFLLRGPAKRTAAGWLPRAAAFAGSFLVPLYLQLAGWWRPAALAPSFSPLLRQIGLAAWLFGVLFAVWTIWHLRLSFSIVPQARVLVRSGPYRLARHPVYLSYALAYLGLWLANLSWALAAVLTIWLTATLLRIHFEEQILLATFPEYAEYRRCVGMFCPRSLTV
jgi:protein-S-isoprenylcysteine O-methyltransferase Ste14